MCYHLYKNPKYLSCHHSYCEECLEKLQQVESRIICPACRAQSAVPAGGVKDLPANFLINSMMDKLGLRLKEDDKVLNCNECVKDDPVVAFCHICHSYLCQFCHENHKRSKQFRHHSTITNAKLKTNKNVNVQPKAISLTCREHDIELLFFCETCELLVCKHCMVKEHCDHSYAKARIQACKCQIELEATALGEVMVRDHFETTDEVKKVRFL